MSQVVSQSLVQCVDCRRVLTDVVSLEVRRGPVCRRRAGIVVVVLGPGGRRRPGPGRAALGWGPSPDQLELALEEGP